VLGKLEKNIGAPLGATRALLLMNLFIEKGWWH